MRPVRYAFHVRAARAMSDDTGNLTVRVLQGIRQDLQALRVDVNTRLDGLNDRVDGLSERVNGLERATIAGFEGVHRRLEAIRDLAGDHWRDHEARIRRLEAHTGLG
jgi:hypothetical protein